jgi:hypothetical protein
VAVFITFRDWDLFYKWPLYKVRWTDDNKIGYVTKEGVVIYPLRRGLKRMALAEFKRPYKTIALPYDLPDRDNIEVFYTQNVGNRDLFFHGLNALKGDPEYAQYFQNPIKLPILSPITIEEFERRWEQFVSLLRPGDSIQLVDTKSVASRMIARFDHGSWSHTASYVGNGYIVEAITSRVVLRELTAYRSPRYRIGLYRVPHTPESLESFTGLCLSTVGDRYSYKKVFVLAFRKLFGLKLTPPLVSPNDTVLIYNFPLIFVV